MGGRLFASVRQPKVFNIFLQKLPPPKPSPPNGLLSLTQGVREWGGGGWSSPPGSFGMVGGRKTKPELEPKWRKACSKRSTLVNDIANVQGLLNTIRIYVQLAAVTYTHSLFTVRARCHRHVPTGLTGLAGDHTRCTLG